MTEQGDAAPVSTWALVGFWMSLLVFLPGVPLLGAVLGLVGWVEVRRSGGRKAGAGFAQAAMLIGLIAGTTAVVALSTVVWPGTLGVGERARAADVAKSLRAVERRLHQFHARHDFYPQGDTGWTPDGPCCDRPGRLCRVVEDEWRHPVWRVLEFVPLTPTTHQLRYVSTEPNRFEVQAREDAGCDDTPTLTKMRGGVSSFGAPVTEPWSTGATREENE